MSPVFGFHLRGALVCFVLCEVAACGSGFVDSSSVTAPGTTPQGGSGTSDTTGKVTSACGVDAYSNYAQAFFQQYCVSCHTNEATYAGIQAELSTITNYIQTAQMPLGSTLPAADKARIEAWLSCGSPQDPNAASTTGGTTTGGTGSTTTGGTT